ncbi:MAG: DUF1207 domain-containing protein [Pirellulales bacterium]|nr:DUF1207 domain-containing protein [Pirellulales bacterium]
MNLSGAFAQHFRWAHDHGHFGASSPTAVVHAQEGVVQIVETPVVVGGEESYGVLGPPVGWNQDAQVLPPYSVMAPASGAAVAAAPVASASEPWELHYLPLGTIYRAYLADVKESRLSARYFADQNRDWFFDFTLGGRFGLLRYGTRDALLPQGFQIDVEAAAMVRTNPQESLDLESSDYRAGIPLSWSNGNWRTKLAYYHVSSHVGDEFQLRNPGFMRLNYLRDSVVLGQAWQATTDWRLYAEAEYAFNTDGGAEPWLFQFGVEYSPFVPGANSPRWQAFNGTEEVFGAPFLAVHGNIREEFDYSGTIIAQAGWQWRNLRDGRLLRIGGQYLNGKSAQYQFFNQLEEQLGVEIWYDF